MSLTKNGSDTLTLQSYSNTYTGNTTVNGGTLLVNGSTASASTVTVNSGAALGGLGFIDGAVTVNAGGSLSPGDSSLGTLAIGNILTLNAASTVVMEINKDGGLPSSDLINGLTGALTYAGTLTVNDDGQGVERLAVDQDIELHQLTGSVARQLVVERGVAPRNALHLVEEIEHHFGERHLVRDSRPSA